jgi:hypothetical protein
MTTDQEVREEGDDSDSDVVIIRVCARTLIKVIGLLVIGQCLLRINYVIYMYADVGAGLRTTSS